MTVRQLRSHLFEIEDQEAEVSPAFLLRLLAGESERGEMDPENVGAPEDLLRQIASDVLGIETLESRGSDRLDFHELGVESIREALAAAYEAGRLATGKGGAPEPQ